MNTKRGDRNWQEPQIVEPVPIADTFATGWVIQVNNDFVRIICYADHPLTFPLGDMQSVERQVVAKIVYPKRLFEVGMETLLAGIAQPKFVGNGH